MLCKKVQKFILPFGIASLTDQETLVDFSAINWQLSVNSDYVEAFEILKTKIKRKNFNIWEVDSENLVVLSCPDLKGVANTSKMFW